MGGKAEVSDQKIRATQDQLRLARLTQDLTITDDDRVEIQKLVKKVMETTRCTVSQAEIALYDNNNDVQEAVNAILEDSYPDENVWKEQKSRRAKRAEAEEMKHEESNFPYRNRTNHSRSTNNFSSGRGRGGERGRGGYRGGRGVGSRGSYRGGYYQSTSHGQFGSNMVSNVWDNMQAVKIDITKDWTNSSAATIDDSAEDTEWKQHGTLVFSRSCTPPPMVVTPAVNTLTGISPLTSTASGPVTFAAVAAVGTNKAKEVASKCSLFCKGTSAAASTLGERELESVNSLYRNSGLVSTSSHLATPLEENDKGCEVRTSSLSGDATPSSPNVTKGTAMQTVAVVSQQSRPTVSVSTVTTSSADWTTQLKNDLGIGGGGGGSDGSSSGSGSGSGASGGGGVGSGADGSGGGGSSSGGGSGSGNAGDGGNGGSGGGGGGNGSGSCATKTSTTQPVLMAKSPMRNTKGGSRGGAAAAAAAATTAQHTTHSNTVEFVSGEVNGPTLPEYQFGFHIDSATGSDDHTDDVYGTRAKSRSMSNHAAKGDMNIDSTSSVLSNGPVGDYSSSINTHQQFTKLSTTTGSVGMPQSSPSVHHTGNVQRQPVTSGLSYADTSSMSYPSSDITRNSAKLPLSLHHQQQAPHTLYTATQMPYGNYPYLNMYSPVAGVRQDEYAAALVQYPFGVGQFDMNSLSTMIPPAAAAIASQQQSQPPPPVQSQHQQRPEQHPNIVDLSKAYLASAAAAAANSTIASGTGSGILGGQQQREPTTLNNSAVAPPPGFSGPPTAAFTLPQHNHINSIFQVPPAAYHPQINQIPFSFMLPNVTNGQHKLNHQMFAQQAVDDSLSEQRLSQQQKVYGGHQQLDKYGNSSGAKDRLGGGAQATPPPQVYQTQGYMSQQIPLHGHKKTYGSGPQHWSAS